MTNKTQFPSISWRLQITASTGMILQIQHWQTIYDYRLMLPPYLIILNNFFK